MMEEFVKLPDFVGEVKAVEKLPLGPGPHQSRTYSSYRVTIGTDAGTILIGRVSCAPRNNEEKWAPYVLKVGWKYNFPKDFPLKKVKP